MGIIQRQSIQTSILTYIGAALGYVNFILLYPTYMEPAQVGLVRVLIAVGVLLSQLSMFGSSLTMQRYFPYFNNREQKYYGLLPYMFLISLIGFAAFGLVSWLGRNEIYHLFESRSPLFNDYFNFIYPLAFLLMAFELLFFYARSLLLTVLPIFIREVLLRLMQTVALLVYILADISFQSFLWLFVLTYLLHFIFIAIYLWRLDQLHLFAKIKLKEILPLRQLNRYSVFVYLASIASIYTANIDVIMLSALGGLEDTAVYAVAFFIGALVIIPARAMNQVAIPLVTDAWKRNDLVELQKLYRQTANNQLIVGAFIVLMLLLNTTWVLELLPPIYRHAEWAVYIIAAARLIDMATGINGELILYSKHIRFNLATNLLLIIVSTVTTWWLIPKYGVLGAAISVPIAYLFYNGIRLIFLWVKYGMHPFMPGNLVLLIIFGAMAIFAVLLPDSFQNVVWALIFSGILTLLYWGLVLRLRLSDEITTFGNKVLGGKLF